MELRAAKAIAINIEFVFGSWTARTEAEREGRKWADLKRGRERTKLA